MYLLYRRYSRSGYAPPLFYAAMAIAFVALAIFALVSRDWLIAAVAFVMLPVTVFGAKIVRRLSVAADASRRELQAMEDDHGR